MSEKKPARNLKKPIGIARWFREMKSELKKVVWPTYKQVTKNTGIVLSMIFFMGILIWIADLAFNSGTTFLLTYGK